MNLTEKVAYIKGLTDGLKLDDNKDEVKVLKAITDLLEDLALTVADLEDAADETTELLDVLDEDLGAVEEVVYGSDCEDCGCGCEDDDCDCYDDDEDLYEVTCPTCGDTICVNEEMLDEGAIACPNCGENLEFDFGPDLDTEEEPVE